MGPRREASDVVRIPGESRRLAELRGNQAGRRSRRLATPRLHPESERRRQGRPLCARLEAAWLDRARPRFSPARRVGSIQGIARPSRRGRGSHRPGDHGLALWRLDGQQRRISVEEDDRASRSPSPLFRDVVSVFVEWLGNSRLHGFLRGRGLRIYPGVQHGRNAAGHGRLHRVHQRKC